MTTLRDDLNGLESILDSEALTARINNAGQYSYDLADRIDNIRPFIGSVVKRIMSELKGADEDTVIKSSDFNHVVSDLSNMVDRLGEYVAYLDTVNGVNPETLDDEKAYFSELKTRLNGFFSMFKVMQLAHMGYGASTGWRQL